MKAAVWSLACCCILGAGGELLLATPPVEIYRPVTNPAPPSSRTVRNPVTQQPATRAEQIRPNLTSVPQSPESARADANFGAVSSRQRTTHVSSPRSAIESQPRRFQSTPTFEAAEPRLVHETIVRPWEVQDTPRPLKPSTQVQAAELAIRNHNQAANSNTPGDYSNQQLQASPATASRLVAPDGPTRPAQRLGNDSLLGNEVEYRERDSFTYSVRTTTIGNESRTARATPAREIAPRPLKGLKPTPVSTEVKTRTAVAPHPSKSSSNLRRTAPSRWFRANPLRESSIVQNGLRSEAYVQQASAQSPTGEAVEETEIRLAQQPAATETLDQIPSIGDDQPLPFDLNAAEKEAAPPAQIEAKQPTTDEASESLEDNLSLDNLPFGDEKEKAPAEVPTEPPTETNQPSLDNLFPESTEKKPAPELPAKEESTTPEIKEELPFPFDVPKEEKKPAEVAPPMKEIPAEKPPAEQVPQDDLPFNETPMESIPQEAPLEQPITTDAAASGDAKSILAITTSIAPPAGELPATHSIGADDQAAIAYCPGQANRGWSISEYNWKASGMFHQPLYFEEVNLERYGYSHGIAQPAISYGQFLVHVIAMPYKVMAEPPREEVYTLGHYRPGSYAPYRIHYPPASISGGLFEAGVVVGLVFLIP